MAEPIGPGDLVTPARVPTGLGIGVIEFGSVYLCTAVDSERRCICGKPGVLTVADPPHPDGAMGSWCLFDWRPISRRSDFARFLAEVSGPRDDVPAPTEREPATA